jgi:hypothetical protein
VPALPDAGVPLRIPVEALNVTPLGKVSLAISLRVGGGEPAAVTVNEPAMLVVNTVLEGLVMVAGVTSGGFTFNMKVCAASGPTPL